MWPVYEIRPPDKYFLGDVFRYAGGQWIPDDGEWDLAFAGGAGAPICLYVDLPYQENIVWSWLTGSWRGEELRHPRANPWHYMLREGACEWGGDWGKERHANTIAGREGMRWLSSRQGCANGRLAEFHNGNHIIRARCMRDKKTKEIFTEPEQLICMYCGPDWKPKQ